MRSGFSLVELSIVLVILGLLVGGVLSGQSLIHAAQLRAVSTEYMRYATATRTFRDKYFALPGDMTNATAFWGTGTCPGTNADTPAAVANTCNGNGDGQIYNGSVTANELFRYWQHLAFAGLIEGSYTGVSASGTYAANNASISGSNADLPTSKYGEGSAWCIGWVGVVTTDGVGFGSPYVGNYGNAMEFGAINAAFLNGTAILTPADAWNIDTKMDDGVPATGNVRPSFSEDGTGATSCGSKAAGTYTLSATSKNCVLGFITGF